MVHHRIPKKKRNKLKSVDPFNRNRRAIKEASIANKNLEVKSDGDDDQPMPKRLLEINALKSQYQQKGTFPKKRGKRNRVFEEALKAGFELRRFENTKNLINRISSVTAREVREKKMLAKFEIAGRNAAEIEAEYSEMDSKEKAKKERTAELKKRSQAKSKLKGGGEGASAMDTSAELSKTSKTLSRKERQREAMKKTRAAEKSEMLLNAREVIPFGSRVDAPPTFSSFHRATLDPVFAKAGKKSLLLKSMLSDCKTEPENEEVSGNGRKSTNKRDRLEADELSQERARVIAEYRRLKGKTAVELTMKEI